MSELNLNDQPVFVSVDAADADPTFPILYTRLLQGSENENVEEANNVVKVETQGEIQIENIVSGAEAIQKTIESTETQGKQEIVEPKPTSSTTPQRITCPECKRYTTNTEEKMLRHLRIHRGENPFQCYVCDYSTYNKAVFEEHVRRHQGIKPFKCSKCDYCSVSKKNVRKHELIHRPDNPLRCGQCEFIARNPQSLKHHVKKHTTANNCPHCEIEFKTSRKFESHLNNLLKCDSCTHKTCNSDLLMQHWIATHSNKAKLKRKNLKIKINKIKNRKKDFQCALCEWSSSTKVRILLHLIHHPKQVVNEDLIDISILRQHGIME